MLPLPSAEAGVISLDHKSGRRSIEDDDFPFARISDIAEAESWRKEIHRPIYHMHKWWAQRLGTVFRAIIIGCFAPSGSDVLKLFHSPVRLGGKVVMDPFMGSGTTVGETLKLGGRAIGRDINRVAYFSVRNAMEPHPIASVKKTFEQLERDLKPEIMKWHSARMPDGSEATALYHFWVKVIPCPSCGEGVDLFPSRVFSSHAYPKKHPESRSCCPGCGAVNVVMHGSPDGQCTFCGLNYDPTVGNVNRQTACCPSCRHTFKVAESVRSRAFPPDHRLYAKMVLTKNGDKVYLPADEHDRLLYKKASGELARRGFGWYPDVEIEPGLNTNQALGYNYRRWHQFFNDRQLLCLGMMAERIRAIPAGPMRDLFTCLFSGTLEFNNMFASFKGEGTGAVRHMFSHHILKPERTPLEANPWGTEKSSGAFSTLFKGRILKALEHGQDPYELGLDGKSKVRGLSVPFGHERADDWKGFAAEAPLYLSCGDSSKTDIPPESVDAVVTDPPFFDNVNYSQLADFFHVWQRHILGENGGQTTRSEREVQHGDSEIFGERLGAVWRECHRVLKSDGLLVFSYHHSRTEGWDCVLASLIEAGFVITAAHAVKAEMSVASPKSSASEPIDLDAIIVCRKREVFTPLDGDYIARAERTAARQVTSLLDAGRKLSRNDVRVTLMGQILKELSSCPAKDAVTAMRGDAPLIEAAIDRIAALRP